jgi:hypothetical protein
VLARRELAVILKKDGDLHSALYHRQEVKRLDPSDHINRYNLSFLFCWLGEKQAALQEAEDLLAMAPDEPRFQALVNTMKIEKGDREKFETRTYRNNQHNFEMDIPYNWSFHCERAGTFPIDKKALGGLLKGFRDRFSKIDV